MSSIFSRSRVRNNEQRGDAPAPPKRGGFTRNSSTQSITHNPETSYSAEESRSTKSLRSTFCTRLVKVDDEELASMALDTKLSIDWRSVVLSARVGPARWRRAHILGDFAVYTRQEAQRYGVLAVGIVPGCVAEIVNVLQSQNSAQFAQHMEGIYEHQFREGSVVHRVDVRNEDLPDRTCRQDGAELAELSVKTVTFNKAGWLSSHEEWCYLDSIYRHGEKNAGVVEKFITTMHPKDIIAGLSGAKTKYFHDVMCGYLLRPGTDESSKEDDTSAAKKATTSTRVTFYAEFETPKHFSFPLTSSRSFSMAASDKTIKQRLVKLAESTSRLTALVRRQRLGLQVLVDGNRFFPPMNMPCKVCTNMIMVAKQCRLCGHAVCGDCSEIHERARQPRGGQALQVVGIRVCAACIERVDQAEYKNLSSSSLLGSAVVPDPVGAKSAAAMLKDLLQDALLTAPSPNRKACVMSVIKCVLNQENEEELAKQHKSSFASSSVSGSATPVALTPTSSVYEYVNAMDFLEVDQHVELRSDEHRSYLIDPAGSSAVPHPVPEDENARLRAVSRVSVTELQSSAELEILCDVAAKEMGCMTSAISIIDSDTFHVVASNTPEMRSLALPRESAMCSHTIMEKSPLIVKHPEADVRFSKFDSVDAFGVRYYCAFPLMGENDQIIGAMCCINSESMDITESQFAAFKKLTSTASKVVQMQTNKRARKLSTASSTASSESSADARVAPSA